MKRLTNVRQTDAAFEQAVALHKQGNLEAAEKIYRALLKQNPNHFRTLHNLADALLRAERHEDAVQVLRKALNQEPNSAVAHTMLANALRDLERCEEALERARRAIALEPGLARAHATLAGVLAESGQYDEAVSVQARAIELAPDEPFQYYLWGYITRWKAGDPRITALETLAQKFESLPRDDQVYLHFALAKAYADCGDLDRAFRHQIRGGALKRDGLGYDEAAALRLLTEMRCGLDGEWIRQHQAAGDPSPLPVFILGMPRSGTTLVEQVLASHPRVQALGEQRFFEQSLAQICGTPVIPPSLPQLAAGWSGAELRRLGSLYVEAASRGLPASTTRITVKTPTNFRFLGLIHAALPNARIIHTVRDPVDTCLSIFSILFTRNAQPYSYDLGELGRYYHAYEEIMAHWRSVLPAGTMLELQYEEVVDDVERQARRIIAHCGLEWDDACLDFHKADRPVRTASHAQVRQPIYRSSVGRPRPPRALLLPLLEALGVE